MFFNLISKFKPYDKLYNERYITSKFKKLQKEYPLLRNTKLKFSKDSYFCNKKNYIHIESEHSFLEMEYSLYHEAIHALSRNSQKEKERESIVKIFLILSLIQINFIFLLIPLLIFSKGYNKDTASSRYEEYLCDIGANILWKGFLEKWLEMDDLEYDKDNVITSHPSDFNRLQKIKMHNYKSINKVIKDINKINKNNPHEFLIQSFYHNIRNEILSLKESKYTKKEKIRSIFYKIKSELII